MINYKDFEKL